MDQAERDRSPCNGRAPTVIAAATIEAEEADLDDLALKERIAGLKAIRDQAQADAERTTAMLESSGQQALTPAMVRKLAGTAGERVRIEGGGYRRDHLRALVQRSDFELSRFEAATMRESIDLALRLVMAY